MIYDGTSSSHYVQTGYIRRGILLPNGSLDLCMVSFSAYNNGGGQQTAYGTSCLTIGSYYHYQVWYIGPAGGYPVSPSGHFSMTADTGVIQSTPFDPWNYNWSFYPAIYGEGQYADYGNIPGTTNPVANVAFLQIESIDNQAYTTMPCYLVIDQQHPRYHTWYNDCSNVYIWTQ